MNRRMWKSRAGEPWSIVELAVWRVFACIVIICAMAFVTFSVGAAFCVGLTAYLLMDRVQIIIDWGRELRAARQADARMMAALNAAPVREFTAMR